MGRGATIGLGCALLLAGCAGRQRDWAFVQSVGGIAVGTPYRAGAEVMLPVAVDVSGAQAITTRPTALHSGLGVEEVTVRREGQTLALTLVTGPARAGHGASPPDVALGRLEPGRYRLVYDGPDGGREELGAIAVP